jgi:hypothetical protein
VGIPIELIRKQLFDLGATKHAGWQTYAVNHQGVRQRLFRAGIAVWARDLPRWLDQATFYINTVRRVHWYTIVVFGDYKINGNGIDPTLRQ